MQRLRDCLKTVFRAIGELISTMLLPGEFWEQHTRLLPVSVHLVVIVPCLWLSHTAAFSLDKIQERMTFSKVSRAWRVWFMLQWNSSKSSSAGVFWCT